MLLFWYMFKCHCLFGLWVHTYHVYNIQLLYVMHIRRICPLCRCINKLNELMMAQTRSYRQSYEQRLMFGWNSPLCALHFNVVLFISMLITADSARISFFFFSIRLNFKLCISLWAYQQVLVNKSRLFRVIHQHNISSLRVHLTWFY